MDSLHIPIGQAFNIFSERLPAWSGWLACMVLDESGNHVGSDGNSKSISNEADLQLLLALRSKASVIVTTGKTARAEGYKSSRFAPIAFLTRSAKSLASVPALLNPGSFENIFLETNPEKLDFKKITNDLKGMGFKSFLFEGGPETLRTLLQDTQDAQLVLTIANARQPENVDVLQLAKKVLNLGNDFLLVDDFYTSTNRVTRWVKQAF